jgi:hypothetical protein
MYGRPLSAAGFIRARTWRDSHRQQRCTQNVVHNKISLAVEHLLAGSGKTCCEDESHQAHKNSKKNVNFLDELSLLLEAGR